MELDEIRKRVSDCTDQLADKRARFDQLQEEIRRKLVDNEDVAKLRAERQALYEEIPDSEQLIEELRRREAEAIKAKAAAIVKEARREYGELCHERWKLNSVVEEAVAAILEAHKKLQAIDAKQRDQGAKGHITLTTRDPTRCMEYYFGHKFRGILPVLGVRGASAELNEYDLMSSPLDKPVPISARE